MQNGEPVGASVPQTRARLPNMLAAKLGNFAQLSKQENDLLRRLAESRVCKFDAGDDIATQGHAPGGTRLILSGWAFRHKQMSNGRRQILAFFLPGDLCDFKSDLFERMDHSLGALTAVSAAEIPTEQIADLMTGASPLARALWWSHLTGDAIDREWIATIGQRAASERIGHMFCELFLRQRAVGLTSGWNCDMPITQADMGLACGLSTVHVNRTLQDLRNQGLIELRHRQLTILDYKRLADQSLFSPRYLHLGDHPVVT